MITEAGWVHHARQLGPVTVTRPDGSTYPAHLAYWHTRARTGRGASRARIILADGTARTVRQDTLTVAP